MIPPVWQAVVLTLAAYRLVRLLGWDVFPPVARARSWLTGEQRVSHGSTNARLGVTGEQVTVEYRYRRPTLAELLHCAYCSSFWVASAGYAAWLIWPRWTLYAAFPFAVSAAVGTFARWLDP